MTLPVSVIQQNPRTPISQTNKEVLANYAGRQYELIKAWGPFQESSKPSLTSKVCTYVGSWLPSSRTVGQTAGQIVHGRFREQIENTAVNVITNQICDRTASVVTQAATGYFVRTAILPALAPVLGMAVPAAGVLITTGLTYAGQMVYNYLASPQAEETLEFCNEIKYNHEDGSFTSKNGIPLDKDDVNSAYQSFMKANIATTIFNSTKEDLNKTVSGFMKFNNDFLLAGMDDTPFTVEEIDKVEAGIAVLRGDNPVHQGDDAITEMIDILAGKTTIMTPIMKTLAELDKVVEEFDEIVTSTSSSTDEVTGEPKPLPSSEPEQKSLPQD